MNRDGSFLEHSQSRPEYSLCYKKETFEATLVSWDLNKVQTFITFKL